MAKYAQLTDAVDSSLTITERHLAKADVYLDAEIIRLGFSPDAIVLPIPILTEIAALMALDLAAIEQLMNDDSVFIKKHEHYLVKIKGLLQTLCGKSLGLTAESSVLI